MSMAESKISKIDPKTGLKYRTVNIANILSIKDVPNLAKSKGPDILKRAHSTYDYVQKSRDQEIWLYNRRMLTGPASEVLAMDQNNNLLYGINFASADYLGLSQSQTAKEAVVKAAKQYGISTGGSPTNFGANRYYLQLKEQLAAFLDFKGIVIYSAGWLAGYGSIKGLVGKNDFVIMDQLSHNCLQEGAKSATQKILKFPHLNHEELVKLLTKTRSENPNSGILVVTQGLFSMDSDTPDLNLTQQLCKKFNAFLLIDIAHDFGCMGQGGKGTWEIQKLRDRSNVIIIGTGSKCLSTNIGFVVCENMNVIEQLESFSTAYLNTTSLNPLQCATSLANLAILRSQSGRVMRKKVLQNYSYLRQKLQAKGYKIFGNKCPILPLYVGNEIICRLVSRLMMDQGVHVNGIEFPVVKIGQARLRVNLMPQHTKEHLDTFISVFESSLKKATVIFQKQMEKYLQQLNKQESKL